MKHFTDLLPSMGAATLLLLTAPMGCMASGESAPAEEDPGATLVTTGRARTMPTLQASAARAEGGEAIGTAAEALNTGHGINYAGGHVMSGNVNVY